MINAKQEFLSHTKEVCPEGFTVRCGKITVYATDKTTVAVLPVGYTPEDLLLFLEEIDVKYDNSYGNRELYGTIWYTDGITWSHREEYDGSEWWEYNALPEITPELMGDKDSRL
jgi:hypothetical protein